MKVTSFYLTVLLVGVMVLGGAVPVFAHPGAAPATQDERGDTPLPPDEQPAAQLGIDPDAMPQAGARLADDTPAPDPAYPAGRLADSPPTLMAGGAAAPLPEVVDAPAAEFGISADDTPQAEPFFTDVLYLPMVSGAGRSSQQTAEEDALSVAAPLGTVYAYSARTADAANVTRNIFTVGNAIRYFGVAYNSTGATRSAFFSWLLASPCGGSTLWSGYMNAAPGYSQWYIPGIAPNCPGNYTFTFRVSFAGYTTTRSATFTVRAAGTVSVSSAATQAGTGAASSSFALGSPIRYVAFLNNTTGATRSTDLTYSLAGPCAAGVLWAGAVNTAAGVQGWTLDRTTPGCVGNFTLTVRNTYNGSTTARSVNFTVYQPTTVAVTAVRTADRANTTRTTFAPGALMRYIGAFANNTGASRSVYTVWSLAGPGCTGTLWAGNMTVAPGTAEWFLDGTAPNCLGSYTFSLAVTYNGQTTSRSTVYTIVAPTQ